MRYSLDNYHGYLFDPFFNLFPLAEENEKNFGRLAMKTDIKETKEGYFLQVEMPGVEKKDIKLDLKDGYLTLEASVDNSISEENKDEKWIRRERFSGTASRSYYIGDVDEGSIKAAFKDGILTISFPKEVKKEDKHQILID